MTDRPTRGEQLVMKARTRFAVLVSIALLAGACAETVADKPETATEDLRALRPAEIVGAATENAGPTKVPFPGGTSTLRAMSFQARAGTKYDIWVRADFADAVAYVLDNTFATLAQNDDANATTRDAHVSFTASRDGLHYIAFREYAGRRATMSVELGAVAPLPVAQPTGLGKGLQAGSPWPMFGGGLKHGGQSNAPGLGAAKLKWKTYLGQRPAGALVVDFAPSIAADGTLYVGSYDGSFYALNPSGSVKWKRAVGVAGTTPAIGANGVVYFGSDDHNVYALKASDGSTQWVQRTGEIVRSSPAIADDGTVYIGGSDAKLYAFDGASGAVKWTRAMGRDVQSSPALDTDGNLYVGSLDGFLYALEPYTGGVLWLKNGGGMIASSPALGGGQVFFTSIGGTLGALDYQGRVAWQRNVNAFGITSPGLGAGAVAHVVDSNGLLLQVGPTGMDETTWNPGTSYTTPAEAIDGTLYLGGMNHNVYALGPVGGAVRWTYATGDAVTGSPAIGADGSVFIHSDDGFLYAFGP